MHNIIKNKKIVATLLLTFLAVATICVHVIFSTDIFRLFKIDILLIFCFLLYRQISNEKKDAGKICYFLIKISLIGFLINYLINCIYRISIDDISYFYMIKIMINAFICVGVFISITYMEKNPHQIEKAFLVAGLSLGCLYLIVMTPLSIPDEDYHYKSSYVISNYIMFKPDKMDAEYEHFNYNNLEGHHNTERAYREIGEGIFLGSDANKDIKLNKSRYGLEYPVQYLPQTLGITLGRIMGLRLLGVFVLGRFFNLVFYLNCCYFAIKKMPYFKQFFAVTALLPMSLHQAASFSSDAFINGLSFLIIAVISEIIISGRVVQKKDVAVIIMLLAIMSPAKIIYFFIAMLMFLLSEKQLGQNCFCKKTLKIICIVAIPVLVTVLTRMPSLIGMVSTHSSTDNYAGERMYSLSELLKNPLATLKIYLKTIKVNAVCYFDTMIGVSLSGLSLELPKRFAVGIYMTIAASIIKQKGDDFVFSRCKRILMAMIASAVLLLVMTALLLDWTPISSDIILGVQGRYLLPVAPLIGFALRGNTITSNKSLEQITLCSLFVLHFFILRYVVEYTF